MNESVIAGQVQQETDSCPVLVIIKVATIVGAVE